MADEDSRTLKEKLLFYTTAFFILLGTFSLFAFLFLVPFVIDPGFTTIFMQFDTRPALCVTVSTVQLRGVSNCSWSSCREGCTKELYECIQIEVNYRAQPNETNSTEMEAVASDLEPAVGALHQIDMSSVDEDGERGRKYHRKRRAIRDYNYEDGESYYLDSSARLSKLSGSSTIARSYNDENFEDEEGEDGSVGDHYVDYDNDTLQRSEWFTNARLFPNVKGCGYPPSLNCTIWTKKYKQIGTNFSCYYSKVDPRLVISDLDMWQNTLNLVYSMAIPIPSFIISVIYLTVAYFKIYNDDEEQAPLDKNAEEIADDDEIGASSSSSVDCCDQDEEEEDVEGLGRDDLGIEIGDDEVCIVFECGGDEGGSAPEGLEAEIVIGLQQSISGPLPLTNSTDLPSSLRAQLIDEAGSRSTENGLLSNSGSIPG